jgi:hypothetical protein
MTPLIRYDRWMKRTVEQQLGFWGEHWADVGTSEQFAAWRRSAEERGASVKHHMTQGLLPEVLYAAGGVERELEQLRTALTEVMRSIEIFIDKVLDAFAADRPARAGGPLPPWQG